MAGQYIFAGWDSSASAGRCVFFDELVGNRARFVVFRYDRSAVFQIFLVAGDCGAVLPVLAVLFLLLVRLNRSVWVRVSFPALLALASAAAMAVGYGRITAATEAGAIPNLTRLYYGTDTHIFGLAAGIVLAFLWSDPRGSVLGSALWRRLSGFIGFIALALVLVGMVLVGDHSALAYRGGMFVVSLLMVLVIASMLAPGSRLARLGEIRALRWVGTRSYGLYLWHWPILVLVQARFPVDIGSWQYLLQSGIAILVTCLICEFSFRFVETPIRKRGFRAVFGGVFAGLLAFKVPIHLGATAAVVMVLLVAAALMAAPEKTSTQAAIEAAEAQLAAQQRTHAKTTVESETPPSTAHTQDTPPSKPDGNLPEWASKLSPNLDTSPLKDGEVTAIGDSMITTVLGGWEANMPGTVVLAKSNRQWHQEPDILREELNQGLVTRAVFINLGTNAGVTDPAIVHQVIQMLGPDRIIMLVTLYSPSDFVPGSNTELKTIANQYANVGIIDWNSYVANHPEWLQVDRTHPSMDGMMPYTGYVKDELNKFTTQLNEQQLKERRRR